MSMSVCLGKMADMYVTLCYTRSYLYNTARAVDVYNKRVNESGLRNPFTKDCAGSILLAGEAGTKLSLDAVQIFGGNGYSNETCVGRLVRDAKLYEIGAGTSEIRRWLIGREINRIYEK